MTKRWRPQYECLKENCNGVIIPNKDLKGSWICNKCGLEILDNDVSEPEEHIVPNKMIIESASKKPYVSRSYVPGTHTGGGGSSGRRRKKKPKMDLESKYRDIR